MSDEINTIGANASGVRLAPRLSERSQRRLYFALLAFAFLFRLGYGLCSQFWADDERQVYLIGLKFYATGAWPYFGPDVLSGVQVPGALQGLLVGLPLYIAHVPEAPFVLLNVLSFAALCLFAWYCTRRLPQTPRWFVWGWLLTAPWTLNFSTHVVNPSYVLPGAVLFFVGAFETMPATRKGLVPAWCSNLMMGFALFWVMQLHLSWVVLVPFLAASVYFQIRERGTRALAALGWLACGALLTGCLLAPTFMKYGLSNGTGGTETLVTPNFKNIARVLNPVEGVPARFLSLTSFELARFIGRNSAERITFLRENLWLAPLALFLGVVGLVQPAALIALWFRKREMPDDWPQVKRLALLTVVLLCALFLFSAKPPASHTFYVTFPVAALYGFYCWDALLRRRGWRVFALVFLVCGVVFHAGLAAHNYAHVSLYADRDKPASAIDEKRPALLGERRPGSLY
ncbi:MAG: hypothetical protein QOE46_1671 [Acidobacteriota bacterium]|nr:hypothetical protein [Acidobacteriota bacterium]